MGGEGERWRERESEGREGKGEVGSEGSERRELSREGRIGKERRGGKCA